MLILVDVVLAFAKVRCKVLFKYMYFNRARSPTSKCNGVVVVRCDRFRLDLRDIALGTEDTVDPAMGKRTPRMTNTREKQMVLL